MFILPLKCPLSYSLPFAAIHIVVDLNASQIIALETTVGNELLPGVFLTNETATSYIVYDLLIAIFVVYHCVYFSLVVSY